MLDNFCICGFDLFLFGFNGVFAFVKVGCLLVILALGIVCFVLLL